MKKLGERKDKPMDGERPDNTKKEKMNGEEGGEVEERKTHRR